MSFIQFESGRDKDRARQELREARNELLKQAEQRSKFRDEREIQKKLRGDDQWMLPSVSKKLEANNEMMTKSAKKPSKNKKSKKQKKKRSEPDSDSSTEEVIKKKKRKKRDYSSESSGSSVSSEKSSDDGWIEKKIENKQSTATIEKPIEREDWLSGMLIPTFSNKQGATKKNDRDDGGIDSYDPKKSSRELNPFWKDGGNGLPSFQKPKSDSDDDDRRQSNFRRTQNTSRRSSGWRKHTDEQARHRRRSNSRDKSSEYNRRRSRERRRKSGSRTPEHRYQRSDRRRDSKEGRNDKREEKSGTPISNRSEKRIGSKDLTPTSKSQPRDDESNETVVQQADFLTDQQMNELGAKIVKAEILGNDQLASELKEKLEKARGYRNAHKKEILAKEVAIKKQHKKEEEQVMLTKTNSQGVTKPLNRQTKESDLWGGRAGRKKNKKVETHTGGERVRYFADDDKYDIKQMFENEKFVSAADQDAQFADIAGKHKNPNDDLEDIFSDKVRKEISQSDQEDREKAKAIRQHEELKRTLESCDKCFESSKMEKQLIVSMGNQVYLSLPWHEGLQIGHCMIVPMQHVSCSTQLDEDVWNEVQDYRKSITRIFQSRKQDVIFFETVRYLNRNPHMVIHCVPNKDFELAPFYFKKAIQESEREWSTNKQLIQLKDKDIRRSIPKGLPYFWVHFGMDQGLAHVIEEQDRFPSNFAQETIGGLLNLDARLWRKPRKEQNSISKVKQFADWWKPFDIDVK